MATNTGQTTLTEGGQRDRELARRLRRLGVTGRRLRRGWTRERTVEILRTLAWTIPLTLLLWIWAQEQQLDEQVVGGVRVRLSHVEADRFVRRVPAPGLVLNRADGPLDVTLALRGPRAGLQDALRELRDPASAGLEVQLTADPVERTSIDLQQALRGSETLSRFGVTLAEVTPASVEVSVEGTADERVPVATAATGLPRTERVGEVTFEPAQLAVSAPERVMEIVRRVMRAGEPVVVAALPEDAAPGPQTTAVAVTLAPEISEAIVEELGSAALERLRLEPAEVAATFTRSERQIAEHTLPAVAVYIDKPAALESGESVTLVVPTGDLRVVNGIRVSGPRSVIDRLKSDPAFAEQVQAHLIIEPNDRYPPGRTITRALVFTLPPEVELRGEAPSVTFSLATFTR